MIFGFLLFTSCLKPTWSESAIKAQPQPQQLWASVFPTSSIHSDSVQPKEPLHARSIDTVHDPDSEHATKTLSWLPSHNQLWNFRSISSTSSSTQTKYANWHSSLVTVFAHTPCDEGTLTWQAPQLEATGTKDISSQYTILNVSIPPYLEKVTLNMQCGTTSWTDTWNKKDSHTIPTVQWTTKEHSIRIIASNAEGHTLRLWNLKNTNDTNTKGQLLHTTFIGHTLDGWEIEFPLTSSNKIQFQLSNNQNQVLLTSEPITTDFQQSVAASTLRSSNEQDLRSNKPQTNPSKPLLDHVQPPKHLINIPNSLDSVHNMFVANGDNIWDWYNQPRWKSFHPNQDTVSHTTTHTNTPLFLRWGDTLKVSDRSFNGWHSEEHHHWIMGNPYDTTTSLTPSPEDGLLYDSHVESVMGAESDIVLSRPSTHLTPWLVRTDSQTSDERLIGFLPLLMEPPSLLAAATILHHTALYWDAIKDRSLPWFNTLQQRSIKSLKLLESIPNEEWTQLDFHTQVYIVWASFIADQEGLSPKSVFMRRNIDWLCTLSDTDISEDAAITSHLRWLLRESPWKHRSCEEGESLSLNEHTATMTTMVVLRDQLKQAMDDRTTLPINTQLPEWQQWILLEEEQHLLERYTNLHIRLKTPTTTISGLFHEWQIRPVVHTLSDTASVNIHVNGVGRLYLSTWQPYIHTMKASSSKNLQVTRTILDSKGIPLPSNTISLGQALQIQTIIQTLPNEIICIRQWGASGLSHQSKDHHFCTQSNAQGVWSNTEFVHVQFEGRFRLPITMVATESAIANTTTQWLQTASIKELQH